MNDEHGKTLTRSKVNPKVRRWQRLGTDFSEWKKTPKPEEGTHLGNMNTTKHAEKFKAAAENFGNWKKDLTKNSIHKDVTAEFDKTGYRLADKKETKKLFGLFNLWIGPHYNMQTKEIVFAPSDLDPKNSMGKTVDKISKGDFALVLKHEAAHAWDFTRGGMEAKAEGAPDQPQGYSYWNATHFPTILRKAPKVPDWMRDVEGPMGRFAYAAVVPEEMPAIMTEMAHGDHVRYHVANELLKKHDIDLDGMMTDFYGKPITPPRPKDGSVEKLKADVEKGVPYLRWGTMLGGQWGYDQYTGHLEGKPGKSYADAAEGSGDDMPWPDHRISWMPLGQTLALFRAAGGGKQHQQ